MTEENEIQSWEDFCTFESTGVDEFAGPKAEERLRTDKAVWKTLDRRSKEKRMVTGLAAEPELFQKYQETLQNQLNEGIIEEVDETRHPDGGIVHYLPHRAVVTPQKSTTKLRIVFNPSVHLKDAPSLEEVLHRGPTLLPKTCDILLRFRIGDVAVASYVEKALLQVRLHVQDRDATRFLWVKDTSQLFARTTSSLIASTA
uniref:Phosducin domain-containing protein n=1 Tax=Haemonchus contortus TaxID=6289 RepID=A0A7I4YT92_HAECO